MIRKAALYIWLALIAIGILYALVQGKIAVAGYEAPLPPPVSWQVLFGYGAAMLGFTLLNFYLFFHPRSERAKRRARRS